MALDVTILIARRYFITGSVVRSTPASVAAAVRSASTVTIVVTWLGDLHATVIKHGLRGTGSQEMVTS